MAALESGNGCGVLPHTNREYCVNQHAMALEAAERGVGLAMGRWYLAMPAVLRGELVIPVDYKFRPGWGMSFFVRGNMCNALVIGVCTVAATYY